MNTLPNRRYLVTHSTIKGLSLNNDERQEAMNGYFANLLKVNFFKSTRVYSGFILTCPLTPL